MALSINQQTNTISAAGTGNDTLVLVASGTGALNLQTAGGVQLQVIDTATAVDYVTITGSNTTLKTVKIAAVGTDTDIGIALTPKGNGALQAQVSDGTTTGGDARGTLSTDWQRSRSASNQVAGGANSTIGGGANNRASGQGATISGGAFNTASGAFNPSIGGGSSNIASHEQSTVAGGWSNTSSGYASAILGGYNNTASGYYNWCPGGTAATTRGAYGRGVWAAGSFATQGDAQSGEHMLRRITTDATATRLTADNAVMSTTNTINLPNNGTCMIHAIMAAQQTAGTAGTAGDCAGWDMNILIKRGANAAATVLVGSGGSGTPIYKDTAAAAWSVALAADTTNGGLSVTVTGEANKTIRWVLRIMSVEVTA